MKTQSHSVSRRRFLAASGLVDGHAITRPLYGPDGRIRNISGSIPIPEDRISY